MAGQKPFRIRAVHRNSPSQKLINVQVISTETIATFGGSITKGKWLEHLEPRGPTGVVSKWKAPHNNPSKGCGSKIGEPENGKTKGSK